MQLGEREGREEGREEGGKHAHACHTCTCISSFPLAMIYEARVRTYKV